MSLRTFYERVVRRPPQAATPQFLVSKPRQVLLVPYTETLETLLPDRPQLQHNGTLFTVLPHTPTTQIALRAAGIEAPAPILSYYDWEGGQPFEVQKATAALATSHTRSYILNDMGTGKTRAALWAWRYLNRAGCAHKLLVVAPLSTLKFTWLREISLTMPDCKAVVLHGTKERRLKLLALGADIFIINHEGLAVIERELWNTPHLDTLVIDELAVYRNDVKRSRRMRGFVQKFAWAFGMTGRPMPNYPTDCWSQCKILTPHTVPKYFRHARSMLMTEVDKFRWVPKPDALETAFSWMQPSVRFSLDDVVELPEAIVRVIDVELSAKQADVYQRLANELVVLIEKQIIKASNAGVAMGKLLQIGAGYVYTHNPEYVVLDSEARQQALLEIIEEASHKLIVFAPWRHLIEGLSKLMTAKKIDHAMVHGDIHKREDIFNAFQNTSRYHVLLAHPQCVHHGITLTAATTSVWYSPITSLEVYEQANARIRRVGQKHKQLFLHLQATAVERKVYAMLRRKQNQQDRFLEMIKTAMVD
jgi:SNF2 family DNA or RNA helicase